MRRFPSSFLALCIAGVCLLTGVAQAQARGNWTVTGSDAGHNNWQSGETKIAKDTVPREFKFLWKIQLGNESTKSESFSEPLLLSSLITARGFKDMVLWSDSNTVYAVDSELGTLIWKKNFESQSPHAQAACAGSNIQLVLEAPRGIHFGAHRPNVPHPAEAAPPPTPSAPAQRRIGVIPQRGFGIKGIYVLTEDGSLHEQILSTGLDYAPPVKFIPEPTGNLSPLNITGDLIYTVTGGGCSNVPNAAWSMDLSTPAYAVNSYMTHEVKLTGRTGLTIGPDGTVYIGTGNGAADHSRQVYPDGVTALAGGTFKVQDWYTPSEDKRNRGLNAAPIAFTYNNKQLIAAPGKNGSLVLLDSASLGGSDHHTPMAETDSISKRSAKGSLASWQDKDGAFWVLASITGPANREVKFAGTNDPAPDGSIVAFKGEEKDGHIVLTPAWISRDLTNPAPPVIANGVVFALSGGTASTHAVLYALDAATGKQLYSSEDAITGYANSTGMSVGGGHVFFTTHDNMLYSFGIPMEH